jgi:hypothetical protein
MVFLPKFIYRILSQRNYQSQPNFSKFDFISELPVFRFYEALFRLFVSKNRMAFPSEYVQPILLLDTKNLKRA